MQKNIRQPRPVKTSSSLHPQSIAVLPFLNVSNDPDNEYFSDGVTEQIINALTKISGLHVTSRTSSFSYKGKTMDIRQIGTQLNVCHILEGNIHKSGERVRITAQLINAEDGYHIWSENFDRNLEEIFEIQDEISRKIVSELSQKLVSSKSRKHVVTKPTSNLEAYNLYLKGLFYWNKWSAEYTNKALIYYQHAVDEEPDFALVYSAMSACYVFLAATGFMSSESAYTRAKEYAVRSQELDPQLSESHLSLAMANFFLDWDWIEAEKYFKKSIELNPGSATAHHNYSLFLSAKGRFSENIEVAETAYQLDPLSLINNNGLGNAYYYAGRFDDAIKQLARTLELDPNFAIAINSMGWVYLEIGNVKKAIQLFKKAQKIPGLKIKRIAPLAYAYAKAGKVDETKKLLEKLNQGKQQEPEVEMSLDLAIVYIGLQEFDKAFYHLEEAYEHHYGELVFLKLPQWKEIADDQRYYELVRRIGI